MILAFTLMPLALVAGTLLEEDQVTVHWPAFRGERAAGVAEGWPTSIHWDVDAGTNILWSTEVPGLAHSSPIVWGNKLFVTSAVKLEGEAELSSLYGSPGYGAGESVEDEGAHAFTVSCLDKRTGKVLWTHDAHRGVPRTKRHPKASHASPTPACDANNVVAFFGSEGLYCYDHAGELRWRRDLGVMDSAAPGYGKEGYQWGFASSPAIAGERVIVQCDHEGESFVAALDLATGEDVWRVVRDENSTWSSPNVAAVGDSTHVLLNGYQHTGAYDLESGAEVWKLVGGGDVPVPTPVVANGNVYLTSAHGRSNPLRAIRLTAEGTVEPDNEEDPHVAWNQPRRGVYMQTPLVYGNYLYACSDGGILGCYDVWTGEELYRERVGDGTTGFSGSPVAASGKIYLTGESGSIFVIKAGRDYWLHSQNEMGETCMATPAISAGKLYIRSRHHVVAIGETK